MSFADLFENSLRSKSLKSGDRFTGEILAIGKSEVFVATGTPTDGAIPARDLLDKQGQMTYKIGDTIAVQVVRIREGEILLKKRTLSVLHKRLIALKMLLIWNCQSMARF